MKKFPAYTMSLLLFISVIGSALAANVGQQAKAYTVGIVPQFDARHIYEIWRPILDTLEQKTGIQLILQGAPTITDFEVEFNRGDFDFAYMNPYHILVANDSQGYEPLVRDVGKLLQGILVVHKDSPIQSPEELGGKTISFPAPNALGASLLLRADLHDLFNIDFIPRYVKTHSSVYLNVALGLVDAGGAVQKTLLQQPAATRDALRVLYRTRKLPPHPFCAHPRVPIVVQNKIKMALIDLGSSEQGRRLLAKIPVKEIGLASMEDYQPLTAMGLDRFYVSK